VAESLPKIEAAREWLAQAEALIYHKEYGGAGLAAYEAAATAARVPLYQRLVDPFTSDEALWEFENLFVLSGETGGRWEGISSLFEDLRNSVRQPSEVNQTPDEAARKILDEARRFVSYCAVSIGQQSGVAA
jgi:uncharacterized protein (UPF0332 family)